MNSPSQDPVSNQVFDELQLSEARFRAMFENAAVGIGILGLDRKIIDANPAMCRMLGMCLEELVGQTPEIVTHADDYPDSTRDFLDLISGEKDYYWSERRFRRKNGEVFSAQVTMNLVRDAKREPLYLVGMIIDIDEKIRALEELRQSEARFRALFDNVAVGIAIMTLERKALAVNPVVEKIIGYTDEEVPENRSRLIGHS